MGDKLKIPTLRFKEFSDEWEEKNLDQIAKFSKGKSISKSDIEKDGILECIRYGQLYTHYKETINEIYSKTNLEKNDLVLSEYGDIIIPASGETQIDIATASCVLKDGVALSGDLNIIKTDEDGVFLSYYLNNAKKIDIAKLSQGISVVHLYSSQLKLLKLNLPQKQEQEKIASFLSSIDKKIEQLSKKDELLHSYKKGVMQKIFSQEIRFSPKGTSTQVHGENDGSDYPDWEEKKLKEQCINIYSGKTKPKEDGKFNVYGSTGIIGKADEFTHEGNYVLVARVGANAGQINYVSGQFAVTDNTLIVEVDKNKVLPLFILSLLNIVNLNRLVFGSGQPLITGGELKSLKLKFPCLEEQRKIANFLSSIDTKISQNTKALEETKKFKKALLQQMFV